MSSNTTDYHLRECFEKFGEIDLILVNRTKSANHSKFVENQFCTFLYSIFSLK